MCPERPNHPDSASGPDAASGGVRWPQVASYAVNAGDWCGREHDEPEHAYRNPFQRDRDRIVHCAAFRRLQDKMQVFTGDFGDYHRTRLTHTLEVVSIARTLGRVLELNEDLVEALGLLHDIGHPPFGHAGEDVLDAFLRDCGGFNHNAFALQLVRETEIRTPEFRGLNLSRNILDCQTWRAGKQGVAPNLECQVVDLADSIAYNAHDLDDALQLGLLDWHALLELPIVADIARSLPVASVRDSETRRKILVRTLIDEQVTDAINNSRIVLSACKGWTCQQVVQSGVRLGLSHAESLEKSELERFLFSNVYRHPRVVAARDHAQSLMSALLLAFEEEPSQLPNSSSHPLPGPELRVAIAAHIAGMTDQYCLRQHDSLVRRV